MAYKPHQTEIIRLTQQLIILHKKWIAISKSNQSLHDLAPVYNEIQAISMRLEQIRQKKQI
jgi:hypothetical protein